MKRRKKSTEPTDNRQYQEYLKDYGGARCPVCGCPTTSRNRRGDFQTEVESKTEDDCIRRHKCAECEKVFYSMEKDLTKPTWWIDEQ